MLLKIEENLLHVSCNNCGNFFISIIQEDIVHHDDVMGFNSYANDPCPRCGVQEAYNMTLPLTDEEEAHLIADQNGEGIIPYNDVNQRHYIRQLMHRVRPDLKEGS